MAIITVTNLNNSGAGSLRQAVVDADASVGVADTIVFAAGLSGTIALSGGVLVLSDDVTIIGDTNGDGKADITLSGGNTQRIFYQTNASTDVVLKSLTLVNGYSSTDGGAIAAYFGTLSIQDCTVSGSHSNINGGGISTFLTAVTITDSLINGNSASTHGGGLYSTGGSTTLVNSTVVGNNALYGGGLGSVNTTTLINSTVTSNTGSGGGIFHGNGIYALTITNSVVADNFNSLGTLKNDVQGTIATATNSVFGTAPTITTNTASLTNVANIGLGYLGDHGGTTNTRDILAGSILINAGSNAGAAGILTDANGNARIASSTVDVGATEHNIITVTNLNDQGAGSLRAALTLANGLPGLDHIVFANGMSGTINLTSGLMLTNDVTINGDTNGDGDGDITLAGGGNNVLMIVNFAVNASLDSLVFSGVTQDVGVSALLNYGSLAVNYSVFSNNTVLGLGSLGILGATVVNAATGNLQLYQSVFANNSAVGQHGKVYLGSYGANGGDGGNASASILNLGILGVNKLAVIGSTASAGNGGDGINGPLVGGNGGNSGAAAIGILNSGTVYGNVSNQNPGNVPIALPGVGGAGNTHGTNGTAGQVSTTNLTLAGGTSSLTAVLTGTQNADTNSTIGAGQNFYGLGGADILTGASGSGVFGGAGNDLLTSSGSSTVGGGLGNDVLRTTFLGSQAGGGTWDGDVGIDTFDASLATGNYPTGGGLTLNLATGANNFGGQVFHIENITGTNNSAWSDKLTGDAGVNIIQGMAGGDYIDGGAGADFLFGGDGDDVIVFDAADLAANVDGGNGGDTLAVVNGNAPLSFNLVAQHFEQANVVQTDVANNQVWIQINNLYTSAWQLFQTSTLFDNSTTRDVIYDYTNTQSYVTFRQDFDTNHQKTYEYYVFDDSTSRDTTFDYTPGIIWSSLRQDYNATSQRTYEYYIYDDNTSRDTTFDYTPGIVWSSLRNDYDAANFRTYEYYIYDNGTSRDTTFDNTPGVVWQSLRNDYNAANQKTYEYYVYDNGTSRDTTFDFTAGIVWQSLRNDYNAAAQKTYEYYVFDNGTSRDTSFDYGAGQVWQSLRNDYTATNQLSYQYYVFDNNTSRQVVYDVANLYAWNTQTTNYDINGNVVDIFYT